VCTVCVYTEKAGSSERIENSDNTCTVHVYNQLAMNSNLSQNLYSFRIAELNGLGHNLALLVMRITVTKSLL
jgi:hypothetical protein